MKFQAIVGGRRARSGRHLAFRSVSPAALGFAFVVTLAGAAAAAPTLSSIIPSNGPTAGGTSLTINGSNFSALGNTVFVDGQECGVTAPETITRVICSTPPGSGATNAVQVFDDTDTPSTNTLNFAYDSPSLTSISPSNGPTTGTNTLTLTGTNFAPAGNSVTVNNKPCPVSSENVTTVECTVPAGVGGALPVQLNAGGQASNVTMYSYDAPVVSSVTPSNGPKAGGTVITINGQNFGAPGTSRTMSVNGFVCPATAGADGHTSVTCTVPAGQGAARTVRVSVGGLYNSTGATFSYDGPVVSSVTPSNGPTSGGTVITISGSSFSATGNSASVGGASCPVLTESTTQLTCALPEGTGATNDVHVTDGGGVTSSVAANFTYDAPVVSSVTPSNGPKAGGAVLTISGQNFGAPGTSRTLLVGGNACPPTAEMDGHTDITCTLPAGQGTGLDVTVVVEGRVNSPGAMFSYDGPVISSITPLNGPTSGGSTLTINGHDFSAAGNTPTVGGAACPPTSQSSSQILCTLPEGTGASNDVTVEDGVGASSGAVNFAYDAPAISSITPGNGPTAGGSILTIVGSNFGPASADAARLINLGGNGCLGLAGQSDHTMIRCSVPSGAGVDRSVSVEVDGQSSNSKLFDYDAPSITSVLPQNGPTAGFVPITIRGQNFAPDSNTASIGGNACAVSSETTSEIVCDLPEGTGTGRIVSMDAAGQGAVGPLFHYDPPLVTSVTPSNGPTAGSVPITINGLNFGAAGADGLRSATIGTADCPLLPSSSGHTSIVCTLPEGQGLGNTVHVVVDTQPSNSGSFGYDAPLISSITPASPPAAGNVPITIQGANFGLSATATVGGTTCPVVEQTHTSLTCTLPAGSGASVPVLVLVSGQVGMSSLDYKTPVCGDGVNDPDEDCDDSNPDDFDGCSARCETEDSQDKDQAACIVGLNKSGAGVAKAQGRAVLACAKEAAVGVTCIGASTVPEGVAKASAKVTSTFDKKCTALPDFGPVDAAVVSQAAIDQDLALAHAIFGADPDAALVPDAMNPARSDCQQDVIAATEKLMGAGLKAFGKCKKDGLKEETIRATSQLGACLGYIDEDSNWDKAAARVTSVLADSCAGVDLAAALPGDCASAPDKGACLEGRVLCHTCHLLVIGDNLDENCDLIDDLTDNGSCD